MNNKYLFIIVASAVWLSSQNVAHADDEDFSATVDSYSTNPSDIASSNNPGVKSSKDDVSDPTISSDAFSDKTNVKGAVDFQTAYEHMTSRRPDMPTAFYYLQKAADKRYCTAYGYIGMMLIEGLGTNQDYAKAFEYFEKGDKCKDFQSTFGLGICYENGYGVKDNLETAIAYYKKAADADYAPAQYNLSMVLFSLDSGSQEALNYLKKAARNRYAPALDLFYHAIDENRRKEGTMENEVEESDE